MVIPFMAFAAWRVGAIICLIFVFGFAGIGKLRSNVQFVRSVEAFTGLPSQYAAPVARWLPRVELVLSLTLLIPPLAPWAAGVICLLLVSFLLGALHAQSHGSSVECNCFGNLVAERPGIIVWWRNILLLCIAASVVLINVPLTVSDQWLLVIAVPGLLVLITLHVEVLQAARAV